VRVRWHGCSLVGEVVVGAGAEVEVVGEDHGLVEDHLVTYHHGRDLVGYLVEELAGGSLDGLGDLDGCIHGLDTIP